MRIIMKLSGGFFNGVLVWILTISPARGFGLDQSKARAASMGRREALEKAAALAGISWIAPPLAALPATEEALGSSTGGAALFESYKILPDASPLLDPQLVEMKVRI